MEIQKMIKLNQKDSCSFSYYDYCFLIQLLTDRQLELAKKGTLESDFDFMKELKQKLWIKITQWSSE